MGENVIGSYTKVKVVKNKVAPPFKSANIEILYGTGVSKVGEIVDLATEDGILEKSGSWYSYNGEKIGQGRETVKSLLTENKKLALELENKIREKHGLPVLK
jgi:recombination protein RecA